MFLADHETRPGLKLFLIKWIMIIEEQRENEKDRVEGERSSPWQFFKMQER